MPKTIDDDTWRDVLNRLVLKPRLKAAARNAGINPTTLFAKIKDSVAAPDKHTLSWLGHDAPFFQHVNAARKLSVVALDHAARDLALNGHSEPRFFNGAPVWRRDPQIEADAITLDELDWIAQYGVRPRTDTLYRDPATGALEQEKIVHPPNPAVLVKLLTSLAPEIYGERSEVTHTHQGSVWIAGQGSQSALPAPGAMDFNHNFGLTASRDEAQRPTNVLAIPRPCVDSDEFDKRFRKKLVREVVMFRDTGGKLLPPLPDDVVVAGTIQARAFEDSKIEVTLVRAEQLLDEGFENDFLVALAPDYKRKPKPKLAAPTEAQREEAANKAAEKMAQRSDVVPAGRASARYDAENIGYGWPKPGGRRIVS
jgi:hypothetical protein